MPSADEHLKAWLSAYLGGEEQLRHELTNVRSGVVRAHEGSEETTEPPEEFGAVAAVTDRRTLFLVGGADDGEDDAASVPHEEVAGVTAEAEFLATRFVLTTAAGATWRFTARETEELDAAVAYVTDQMAGTDHVERALSTARDRREAAEGTNDPAAAAGKYDDAVEAYRRAVALRTEPAVEADVDPATVREEVLSTVEAAIDTHLDWARQARSRGNWDFQAGDEDSAHDHLSTALDAFERALELAEQTPPGDPAAIAEERDDLLAKLDELEIRTVVATHGED
jgi:tetratricopeptide (TPR) repeat protein